MDHEKSEEQIQLEMAQTRASLTEKLESLEQKVVGTVENATTTVNETVVAIKESVHETVATVQEGVKGGVDSVKELFDVPAQVDKHPWLMVGGSIAVGYCVGTLLLKNSQPAPQPLPPPSNGNITMSQLRPSQVTQPPTPPAEPSIWESELNKLKGLALGMLFGTAREMLVSSMPEHMGDQLKELVDNVTRKVGGEPFPSSDWDKLREENPPASDTSTTQSSAGAESSASKKSPSGNGHAAARRW
jgi:ElaB/YqjD/DUF883 family membrane-anchored ribosome-binding protein